MSIRTKVLGFVDVLMRVPLLFVIDEDLKISMGFSTSSNTENSDLLPQSLSAIFPNITNYINKTVAEDQDGITYFFHL